MTSPMTHEQAREVLEALALDALDASERDAVLAHVAGCAECGAELRVLRATLAQLTYAAEPVPMSPHRRDRVRTRLLARAAADHAERGSGARAARAPLADVVPIGEAPSARAARRRTRMSVTWWGAAAAGLIAVASLMTAVAARRDRDQVRGAMRLVAAQEIARRAEADSLRVAIGERDRLIANLTGPQVMVMSLASAGPRSPSARMFWDRQHDSWTFVAHNLTAPRQGRVYQLWLVTPTSKISAGTFMPRVNGDAMMRMTHRLAPGALTAVAVTDEPDGGSAQPSSAPMFSLTSSR